MPPSITQDVSVVGSFSASGLAGVAPELSLGVGKPGIFEFGFGTKSPQKKMRVFYYLPALWSVSTPVLFVMHGIKRDADKYFSKMMRKDLPNKYGFALLCPEFSRDIFPSRSGYNSGNVFRKEDTNFPKDRADWGFSAVESIFDHYLSATGSGVAGYHIYGHSAGAQFVHRHLAFIGADDRPLRVIRAVAANAGFYTAPSLDIHFPFGFGGAGAVFDVDDLKKYLQAPLIILLGERDDDTDHKHLNRSDRAMRQGPHRLARGQHFFEAGEARARELGVPFAWTLHMVPGVGHSDSRMGRAAMPFLFPHADAAAAGDDGVVEAGVAAELSGSDSDSGTGSGEVSGEGGGVSSDGSGGGGRRRRRRGSGGRRSSAEAAGE